ncbi:ABC transporter permease [Hyphomicrobium sp.]|uniref:ABC transporter permease n=1 Tax=Hyphomicrobium sp. TaxID=82 RepID=UPI000FB57B3E|nr:ABC transporter permease [Hyphomicrobium sp.]RUO97474.1 MAG: ABC transporter permease [Hyphomicrobium sp.]
MLHILWAEIAIKAAIGGILLVAPLIALSILGIQRPDSGFWPRIVGGLSFSIAASIWIGLQYPNARGSIGPAALVPINLTTAAVLIAALVMGTAASTRRGKLVIAISAVSLLAFGFLEIAHA